MCFFLACPSMSLGWGTPTTVALISGNLTSHVDAPQKISSEFENVLQLVSNSVLGRGLPNKLQI